MTDSPQTNENPSGLDRLDEELRGWAQVTPAGYSNNLSASALVQQHLQRRKLARLGGAATAICFFAIGAWTVWPVVPTNHIDMAQHQESAQAMEQLRADVDKTIDEIALLRLESELWQRSSVRAWDPSATDTFEPMPLDERPTAYGSSIAIDDERLNAQWQAARRQAALGHALDQWLAVHP